MIVLKLTKENDSDKTLLNFKLYDNLMIRKFIHSDILKLHVNNSCTFVTNST